LTTAHVLVSVHAYVVRGIARNCGSSRLSGQLVMLKDVTYSMLDWQLTAFVVGMMAWPD